MTEQEGNHDTLRRLNVVVPSPMHGVPQIVTVFTCIGPVRQQTIARELEFQSSNISIKARGHWVQFALKEATGQ